MQCKYIYFGEIRTRLKAKTKIFMALTLDPTLTAPLFKQRTEKMVLPKVIAKRRKEKALRL